VCTVVLPLVNEQLFGHRKVFFRFSWWRNWERLLRLWEWSTWQSFSRRTLAPVEALIRKQEIIVLLLLFEKVKEVTKDKSAAAWHMVTGTARDSQPYVLYASPLLRPHSLCRQFHAHCFCPAWGIHSICAERPGRFGVWKKWTWAIGLCCSTYGELWSKVSIEAEEHLFCFQE